MTQPKSPFHRGRFGLVALFLVGFWFVLQLTLFRFQVLEHDRFSQYAYKQYYKKIPLKARRGTIYDRDGDKLATSVMYYDFAADPLRVENRSALARQLAARLGRQESYYRRRLAMKNHFVYLDRRVPLETAGSLLKISDKGFIKIKSFGRYYPFGTYAAQLLGFTDPDNRGLAGLELQYKEALTGRDGQAQLQYNARRFVSYNIDEPLIKPRPGNDLVLTIDKDIQTIVENALDEGLRRTRARSGVAIVLDPNNGQILAMANAPGFDPNKPGGSDEFHKRNRAVTDAFEPGSTMKMFTSAAILQERLHKPQDIVFCRNGKLEIHNHVIRDTKKHGWLSFRKVIEKSSNIGMIELANKLAPNTFFRYLRSFGFGQKTGSGLLGETSGSLAQPGTWSGLSKASISIGQEVSVTALQITSAFAALVNGGHLYRPFVVAGIRGPGGEWVEKTETEEIRQVISAEVSELLKDFMRGVIKRGTGTKAALRNVEAGGKTGTAQKFNRKTKRYDPGRYVASFIGFAPYDRPRYICAVFFDEPKKHYYGGDAAGPVFARILNQIIHFDLKNIDQKRPVETGDVVLARKVNTLPDMNGWPLQAALELLEQHDYDVEIEGGGSLVKTVSLDDEEARIMAVKAEAAMERLPDLRNLTLRQALSRLDLSRVKVILQGSGRVYKQSLAPGTRIQGRMALKLFLK